MWTILKINRKKLSLLRFDLTKKLGRDYELYNPKILIQKYKNNKLINSNLELLGDYFFCYHKNFKNKNILNSIKFSKGLKYFLCGFENNQNEIMKFIEKCKQSENSEGYIAKNFFDFDLEKKYKFLSGPFANQIFKILHFQKNKIRIMTGNFLKTTIKKSQLVSVIT